MRRDEPSDESPGSGADERFRLLVENAAEVIVEIDESGRIRYASPGIEEILGYEPAGLLNAQAIDLVHPDDRVGAAEDYAALSKGGRAESLHRARHRDGSWRWIQDTVTTFRTADGAQRLLAVGRDVTARIELERALEQQLMAQERIAALSRHFLGLDHHEIDDGIRQNLPEVAGLAGVERTVLIVPGEGEPPLGTIYEWTGPGTHGVYPHFDEATARGFRWSRQLLNRGEVVRATRAEALPAEADAERRDMQRRGVRSFLAIPARASGTLVGYQVFESLEREREWSEQEIMQLRLAGEILASAIKRRRSEAEVARRHLAEARVAALSRRFLALDSDSMDDAIREALEEAAELAGADRSCLFAPPANGDARGAFYEWRAEGVASFPPVAMPWSIRKVQAGEVFQIHDPARLPAEAEAERRALESRGVRSVLGIPVRSGDETLGFLAFECMRSRRSWSSQDITVLRMIGELFTAALRRRRAEQELRTSRAQLLQAQKLEAVGRLAGGIAHDFNNLLTVILGFSRPLLSDLAERDPVRADVSEIHAAADRAAALTGQLLTFSRRQPCSPQPVDLNRVLSGLEQLLHRLLGEDVAVSLELAPGLEPVEIDPHQIEQVVMNIAVNARDAMPQGGSLRLGTVQCNVDGSEARRLRLSKPGRYAMLTATDSGCGIDVEDRARIFDPFFTTKEPGAGTGLGLAIAYSVVEQAGGSIAVKGEATDGAVFEILLPCCEGEAAIVPRPETAKAPNGSECVLVVEDEEAVRRLTRRILEEQGYRVLEARDGESALALARLHLDRIDALVTDVVMPGLGGRELAQQLRERRPGLPVLFTSGYPQEPGAAGAPSPVQGAFLQKPFTQDDLLATLRRTLDE